MARGRRVGRRERYAGGQSRLTGRPCQSPSSPTSSERPPCRKHSLTGSSASAGSPIAKHVQESFQPATPQKSSAVVARSLRQFPHLTWSSLQRREATPDLVLGTVLGSLPGAPHLDSEAGEGTQCTPP